jgi:hypothetical protein
MLGSADGIEAAMIKLLLFIFLLPGVALGATTITVVKSNPTTITINSSTKPQVTVNAKASNTVTLNVPGPQGIPGPIGPQGIQGIQGEPNYPVADSSTGKQYKFIVDKGVPGLEEL